MIFLVEWKCRVFQIDNVCVGVVFFDFVGGIGGDVDDFMFCCWFCYYFVVDVSFNVIVEWCVECSDIDDLYFVCLIFFEVIE